MKFGEWKPVPGHLPTLSIQQPWAWLIVNGLKDIENRDWPTNYRGQILIHAGKSVDHHMFYAPSLHRYELYFPDTWKRTHPELDAVLPKLRDDYLTGGIVGMATLVDVVSRSDSPWFIGSYGFVLRDARPLPFVPYKGVLGLFAVPESVLESKQDETMLRARNIPETPPRGLEDAYAQVQELAKAETAKQPQERPVFGDPQWIERTHQKPVPGRCIVKVNGKQV